MSQLTLYTTGTITFTNGSVNLVGVGTSFIGLQQGDTVLAPDGKWYELATAPSDNLAASLDRNYAGATATNSAGGSGWVIFRASVSRDSVRTATKQLTDISSLWRQLMSLTQSDQLVKTSKTLTTDRAGLVLQKALVDMFQVGTFQDDDFSVRYLLASTWTKALGINPTTGATSIYSQLLLGNVVSPTQITATTNDYAPANLAQANILRLTTDNARALTGITGGAPGRVLALMNVGSNELDLSKESGLSAAANRFALSSDLAIPAGGSVLLVYDGTASRWRALGGAGSGGSTGLKGWSPILAYVSNGSGGQVAKIVDWTGGDGTKPATGAYIGATGQVSLITDAVNVNGPQGDKVQFRMNGAILQWSYVSVVNWQDLYTISLIQGPGSALQWTFSSTITDADPGAGKLRFNSATFGSVTQIFIDITERFGVDVTTYLDTWDDSSNAIKGTLTLIDPSQPQVAVFNVTGIAATTGYRKLAVTPIAGGIFTDARLLSVLFTRAGDKGLTATVAPGTVSTLAAGASATVVNAGTANDAVFNFGIPQGLQGVQGVKGDKGDPGTPGTNGTSVSYKGTSTTSVPVATGSVTLTTQANLSYLPGTRVRASSTATPSTYIEGIASAYNSSTGVLSFVVDKAVGSGTLASWNINLAGDPGTADFVTVRKFLYNASAGQTTFSGLDVFSRTLAYTPGFITVVLNGSTLTPNDFTATNGTSVTLALGVNASDVVYIDCSLAYTPANALSISQNGADIADKAKFRANIGVMQRNYIINGGMQVSQENGSTAASPADQSTFYPVDQFYFYKVNTAGVASVAQVASPTPGGSPNRLRVTVTTADATMDAQDRIRVVTPLEGLRVADLRLGTSVAKTVTLQFGVKAPAGTYCISLGNASGGRSYVAEYTISAGEANTDVVKSVTVSLDQTGTWLSDNGIGLVVYWCLGAGSAWQGSPGSWQSAFALGSANQFNLFGTNGNVFELFDVGLYEGVVAPAFQLPDYPSELLACKRYWQKLRVGYQSGTVTNGSSYGPGPVMFSVATRAVPTIAQISNIFAVSFPTTIPSILSATDTSAFFYKAANATGNGVFMDDLSLNARM
jgi:hypothetical protein